MKQGNLNYPPGKKKNDVRKASQKPELQRSKQRVTYSVEGKERAEARREQKIGDQLEESLITTTKGARKEYETAADQARIQRIVDIRSSLDGYELKAKRGSTENVDKKVLDLENELRALEEADFSHELEKRKMSDAARDPNPISRKESTDKLSAVIRLGQLDALRTQYPITTVPEISTQDTSAHDATAEEQKKSIGGGVSETVKKELFPTQAMSSPAEGRGELQLRRPIESEDSRVIEREQKAVNFAQKYNITAQRDAMLSAEDEYHRILATHKVNPFNKIKDRLFAPKELNTAKEKYDALKAVWRTSLNSATQNAPGPEKVMAKFIGIRDTTIRAREVENNARAEALGERGKTVYGKLLNYAGAGARRFGGAYNSIAGGIGAVAARTHESLAFDENFDRQKAQEKYTRASRILLGAAIGTVATGGYGALGIPLSFLFRAARGTFGIGIGAFAGAKAGKVFKQTIGNSRRDDLLAKLRDKNYNSQVSVEEQAREEALYEKGNAKSRAKTQKDIEFWSALIAGGASSFGTGAALHSVYDTPALHEAMKTTGVQPPHAIAVTHDSIKEVTSKNLYGKDPTAAGTTITAVHENVPKTGATNSFEMKVTKGEGADQLLLDLKEKLNHIPKGTKLPPHLDAIQKILHTRPHLLAEQLKLSHATGGIQLNPGDTIDINDKGQLVFHEALHSGRETVILTEKGTLNDKWLDRFKSHAVPRLAPHPAESHVRSASSIPSEKETVTERSPGSVVRTIPEETIHEKVPGASQPEAPRVQGVEPLPPVESVATSRPETPPAAPETEAPNVSTTIETPKEFPRPEVANSSPIESPKPVEVEQSHQVSASEATTLPASAIDPTMVKPYVDGNGQISMFGGTTDQQRDYATAYAKVYPGEPVRFTVLTRGFLGSVKHHVEEIIGADDGTVRTLKVGSDGRPFTAVNPRTFTSILNKNK